MYGNFDVIEVVEDKVSYPALLGIGWDNDSMVFMKFENQYVRVITPMDPQKGCRYIELVKDEAGKIWDHDYNIFEDYIHPTIDGKLGWCSASSVSSDSNDALENW